MTIPSISVVIPTRNRAAFLTRTLAAVLAQQKVQMEVIVVDEASSDGTAALLASLEDPRITVVRHDRARGLPGARNSGLTRVTSDWVAFCDDDDLWAPDKLTSQFEALRAMPDAGWCACGVVHVDAELRVMRSFEPPKPGDVSSLILTGNFIPGGGSGTIARTDIVRDVGCFDTALKWGEDWDMWSRLSLCSPLASVPRPLVAYLIHGDNMSSHSPRFNQDVALIDAKYAEERRSRGVVIDRVMLQGTRGYIELAAGRKWPAAWHFLGQAYRGGGIGSVKRAVAAVISPGTLTERNRRAWRTAVPEAWLREVNGWLPALASVELREEREPTADVVQRSS